MQEEKWYQIWFSCCESDWITDLEKSGELAACDIHQYMVDDSTYSLEEIAEELESRPAMWEKVIEYTLDGPTWVSKGVFFLTWTQENNRVALYWRTK